MAESPRTYRILVADDQFAIREALKMLLGSEGFEVETASSARVVLESMAVREYDTLLLDLNYARDTTSGREGIQLLENIREIDDRVPILIMTAWATIDLAVESVRRGARDFIQKPWDDERLIATIRTHAEFYQAQRLGQRLEAANRLFNAPGSANFIAHAPSMQPVVDAIAQVGPFKRECFDTGGARHRQGSSGADAPSGVTAGGESAHHGEHRRPARRHV